MISLKAFAATLAAQFLFVAAAHATTVISTQIRTFDGDGVISNFTIAIPDNSFETTQRTSGSKELNKTLFVDFQPFDTGLGDFIGAELQFLYGNGSTLGSFIGGTSVANSAAIDDGGKVDVSTDARLVMSTPGGTTNARRAATSYSVRTVDAGPASEILGGSSSNVVSIAGFGVGRTFGTDDLPIFLTAPSFQLDLNLRVTAVADCESLLALFGNGLTECSTRVSGTYGGPRRATLTYVYDRAPVVPPAPVPLPAGLPLLAGALAGLMGLRRLTRRAG